MFLQGLIALGLGLALLVSPALAQETKPKAPRDAKTLEQQKKDAEGMEFDFVDSSEAYWVTRSLNDTIFNAGYSPNAVNLERDQVRRDDKISRMYKPPEVVEVRIKETGRADADFAYQRQGHQRRVSLSQGNPLAKRRKRL